MTERRTPALATRLRPSTDVLTELGFAAIAIACYLVVRAYTADLTDEAVANAGRLIALERDLGVAWEHRVQEATMSVPALSTFFTQFYIWGYFPTLVPVTIWLFLRHRESYRTLRNALLGSGVAGLVVYAAYPCAPPWITDGGFSDTVTEGPFLSVARPSGVTNHLGALPSFHVGWVILVGVVVFSATRSRIVRVLCILHAAAMSYAVVSTGNHWVLDVPAGALLAAVGLLVSASLHRGGRRWRTHHPTARSEGLVGSTTARP